jgi:hypothetical protein
MGNGKPIKDTWGKIVRDGDTVTFSYGIPPVGVRATVKEIDGALWVLTPGHKPERAPLRRLRSYVGCFYREQEDTPA